MFNNMLFDMWNFFPITPYKNVDTMLSEICHIFPDTPYKNVEYYAF